MKTQGVWPDASATALAQCVAQQHWRFGNWEKHPDLMRPEVCVRSQCQILGTVFWAVFQAPTFTMLVGGLSSGFASFCFKVSHVDVSRLRAAFRLPAFYPAYICFHSCRFVELLLHIGFLPASEDAILDHAPALGSLTCIQRAVLEVGRSFDSKLDSRHRA